MRLFGTGQGSVGFPGVAVVASVGLVVSLGVSGDEPAEAISLAVFPNAAEMRHITGFRTDLNESTQVMRHANPWRKARCAPRYTRNAVAGRAFDYWLLGGTKRYTKNVKIYVWEYVGAGVARRAVDGYRRQMAGCHRYRLYVKKERDYPGFPMRTVGVNGRSGQARMRHKFGSSVDAAQRQWLTAVGHYVVQVDATNAGLPRPPFPNRRISRDVTKYVADQITAGMT